MKYLPLVWAALRRRPGRTLLTLLSIVTAFFLFGALQGFNVGINSAFQLMNVAHLVVNNRVSMNAPMPLALGAQIAAIPGVTALTPINFMAGAYQRPTNIQVVLGVDIDQLFKVNSDLHASSEAREAMRRTRTGVLVGRALAQKQGWKIGDRIPIHGYTMSKRDGSADFTFDVVGFYELDQPEWAVRIWGNYAYLNEARASDKDTAIEFYVGIDDPAKSARIAQAIDDTFANSGNQTITQNEKEFFKGVMSQIGDIDLVVNIIVIAVFFTLLFLIANTMAQSVRERIPELATLKSIGFTDSGVQWLVLTEALLLSIVAATFGLLLAEAVLPRITSVMSSQGIGPMHVPRAVYGYGALIALLLALMSGVPPAARARRLRIAAALAGR